MKQPFTKEFFRADFENKKQIYLRTYVSEENYTKKNDVKTKEKASNRIDDQSLEK